MLYPDDTIISLTDFNQVGVGDDLGDAGAAVSAAYKLEDRPVRHLGMLTRYIAAHTSNGGSASRRDDECRRGGGGGFGSSDGAHGSAGDADGDDAGTTKAAAAAAAEAGLTSPSPGPAGMAVASMQAAVLVKAAGENFACELYLRAHGKSR